MLYFIVSILRGLMQYKLITFRYCFNCTGSWNEINVECVWGNILNSGLVQLLSTVTFSGFATESTLLYFLKLPFSWSCYEIYSIVQHCLWSKTWNLDCKMTIIVKPCRVFGENLEDLNNVTLVKIVHLKCVWCFLMNVDGLCQRSCSPQY